MIMYRYVISFSDKDNNNNNKITLIMRRVSGYSLSKAQTSAQFKVG